MKERTALGEKILKHWRENRPEMVRNLEKENWLEEAVIAAQEMTGDMLYEMIAVQKMDYQAAWEIAMQGWMAVPDVWPSRKSSAKSNPNQKRRSPPETSE